MKDDIKNPIRLYVGESGAVIKRCGEHLYNFFNNPSYLGLEEKDLEKNELALRICLIKPIKEKKKFWWDRSGKKTIIQGE